MQRKNDNIEHNSFLDGIIEEEGANTSPNQAIDLSGLPQPEKNRERPSRTQLQQVAEKTGFTAGVKENSERANMQFSVRIYPSTFAEIESFIEIKGWSKRVFLEHALKVLSK